MRIDRRPSGTIVAARNRRELSRCIVPSAARSDTSEAGIAQASHHKRRHLAGLNERLRRLRPQPLRYPIAVGFDAHMLVTEAACQRLRVRDAASQCAEHGALFSRERVILAQRNDESGRRPRFVPQGRFDAVGDADGVQRDLNRPPPALGKRPPRRVLEVRQRRPRPPRAGSADARTRGPRDPQGHNFSYGKESEEHAGPRARSRP